MDAQSGSDAGPDALDEVCVSPPFAMPTVDTVSLSSQDEDCFIVCWRPKRRREAGDTPTTVVQDDRVPPSHADHTGGGLPVAAVGERPPPKARRQTAGRTDAAEVPAALSDSRQLRRRTKCSEGPKVVALGALRVFRELCGHASRNGAAPSLTRGATALALVAQHATHALRQEMERELPNAGMTSTRTTRSESVAADVAAAIAHMLLFEGPPCAAACAAPDEVRLVAEALLDVHRQGVARSVSETCNAVHVAVASVECLLENAFRGPELADRSEGPQANETLMLTPVLFDGVARPSTCSVSDAVERYYRDRPLVRERHLRQWLRNGLSIYFGSMPRSSLKSRCKRLYLPPVTITIATQLELINFLVFACVPTPTILQHLAPLRPDEVVASLTSTSNAATAVLNIAAAVVGAKPPHGAACSAVLQPIGGSCRALGVAELWLNESCADGTTRHQLLRCIARMTGVLAEAVVEAFCEQATHERIVPSWREFVALPCRNTFHSADFSQEQRDLLTSSLFTRQFDFARLCVTKELADHERARHVAALPLDVLDLLCRRTTTKDPYDQLMIRYWRLPLCCQTKKVEVQQWMWDEELRRAVMNLLCKRESTGTELLALLQSAGLGRAAANEILSSYHAYRDNREDRPGSFSRHAYTLVVIHVLHRWKLH